MMKLEHPTGRVIGKIKVPGSKSEANRLLLLRQLYFPELHLENLSTSQDTQVLQKLLGSYRQEDQLQAGDAGTAMRFMTAFLSSQDGSWLLDGSARMRERPIHLLVTALRQLGADIRYAGQEGYPPLLIRGGGLGSGPLKIDGGVSSQFISALMMIGPHLPQGLELEVEGFSVSTPYIYLTANIMRRVGLKVSLAGKRIQLQPFSPPDSPPPSYRIEPDWSAASYWFLISLLAQKAEIYLPGFRQHSLQGDSFVANLFAPLGVDAHYIGAGFRLKRSEATQREFSINLAHNPDLAQTMAVAFAAAGYPARISGLQTLRIKETDRLMALQQELSKTGAKVETGPDFLVIRSGIRSVKGITFSTYGDHRMAMALAPLALLDPIYLENPGVVTKSYGSFWNDLGMVGFVETQNIASP